MLKTVPLSVILRMMKSRCYSYSQTAATIRLSITRGGFNAAKDATFTIGETYEAAKLSASLLTSAIFL